MLKKIFRFLVFVFLVASTTLIYYQEYLILPYYYQTRIESGGKRAEEVSSGFRRELVGEEGSQIETWIRSPRQTPIGVSISFRGNANGLQDHISLPEWAVDHGFVGVVFNYPGLGLSDGTPREKDILDAGARVIKHYQNLYPGKLWLIGYSIGTGPAGILAQQFQPDLLVLFAPYTDLKEIIRTKPQFALYASFSRFSFALESPISKLEKSDFIVATGGWDSVIPPANSEKVFQAYQGHGRKFWIQNPEGLHDRLLGANRPALDEALAKLNLPLIDRQTRE